MSVVFEVAALALGAVSPWWGAARRARGRASELVARGTSPASGSHDVPTVELGVLLAMLAAACRSGASLPRALDAVGLAIGGPDGTQLCRAGRALVLGAAWGDAWRAPGQRLVVVRDALGPTWVRGSPPGPALAAAADAVRRDARARASAAAGRLGVRLVLPLGTCYLPAFVLVGLVPVLVSYGVGLLG